MANEIEQLTLITPEKDELDQLTSDLKGNLLNEESSEGIPDIDSSFYT